MAELVVSRRGDDRQRALDAAIAQIERAFGKGSVMRLGQASGTAEIETVSTGSLSLDIALGVGGLPRGRTTLRLGAATTSWKAASMRGFSLKPVILSSRLIWARSTPRMRESFDRRR